MTRRHWYKREGAAFIEGTMGLSLEEKGAYSLCLDLIYSAGAPIPDDPKWLAGICGCSTRKWNVIRGNLIQKGKLIAENGTIMNGRAHRELAELDGEKSSKPDRNPVETTANTQRNIAENEATSNKDNDLGHTDKNRIEKKRGDKKEEETPSLRSAGPAPEGQSLPSQPSLLPGEIIQFEPQPPSDEAQSFTAYNAAAARLGWVECQLRTEERRKKLTLRLKEAGGLPGWLAALEKAEASPFLMGRAPPRPGQPPFRMHLDFLLQKSSFVKVMEGKYDQRGGGEESGFDAVLAGARASIAH